MTFCWLKPSNKSKSLADCFPNKQGCRNNIFSQKFHVFSFFFGYNSYFVHLDFNRRLRISKTNRQKSYNTYETFAIYLKPCAYSWFLSLLKILCLNSGCSTLSTNSFMLSITKYDYSSNIWGHQIPPHREESQETKPLWREMAVECSLEIRSG